MMSHSYLSARSSRVFKLCLLALMLGLVLCVKGSVGQTVRQLLIISIDGAISPATDDFLKSSLARAEAENARALVIKLNTPGGLLTSMQSMVQQILEARVPVIVYVTPSGAGAMSAGVFITLAGHVAAMSPGTTIGAAHPVSGGGQDITGDMREKVENFAVSLMKAIAEQRGRDVKWAEEAVRESVAITDREALDKKVIDLVASDLEKLLTELEGRTVTVQGQPVSLSGLKLAPQQVLAMSFRQQVASVLSDPNVAILLGLGALLGIGIELYHPGMILPGVVGVICLILSLTAAQVLPLNTGGLALFGLGVIFFIVELTMPSFGIWGVAGIICLVLGSIYLIDSDLVWGKGVFEVNRYLVGAIATVVGSCLLGLASIVFRNSRKQPITGREGLVNMVGVVKSDFQRMANGVGAQGRISVSGELWVAQMAEAERLPRSGEQVRVVEVNDGLVLTVVAV